MSTFEPTPQPNRMGDDWTPPKPPVFEKPKGGAPPCLVYGAIGCGVVLVLLVIGGVAAFFGIRGIFTGLVEEYTDTQPATLPVVEVSDTELQALNDRVAAFKTAVDKGEPTTPLTLSEQDINALIQHDPDFQDLKGKAYVSVQNNLVEAQVSIPLDALDFQSTRGRYLNGAARFNVFMRDGTLFVHLESMEVRGKALPEAFLEGMRAENMAQEVQNDPELTELLDKFESIEVRDGAIIITPKAGGAQGTLVEAPEDSGPVTVEQVEAEQQ